MNKVYIGIDPGKTGGYACILENEIFSRAPIPILGKEFDGNEFKKAIKYRVGIYANNPFMIIIEKSQAMRKQGVTSMFNYGKISGLIEGIVIGLGYPYALVPPQTWQKVMFEGTPAKRGKTKVKSKERAAIVATRLWPDMDWRKSERATNPHDGMVDAALIAEYGRRKNL